MLITRSSSSPTRRPSMRMRRRSRRRRRSATGPSAAPGPSARVARGPGLRVIVDRDKHGHRHHDAHRKECRCCCRCARRCSVLRKHRYRDAQQERSDVPPRDEASQDTAAGRRSRSRMGLTKAATHSSTPTIEPLRGPRRSRSATISTGSRLQNAERGGRRHLPPPEGLLS